MPRILMFKHKKPLEIELADGSRLVVCGCGLSETFPFCSGKHILIQDEDDDKVYVYDERAERIGEVEHIVVKNRGKISVKNIRRLEYVAAKK